MNYLLISLLTYVLLGLDLALRPYLNSAQPPRAPYFLLPLVVYIALHGPSASVLWTALGIGLLADLAASQYVVKETLSVCIVGPHALGYLAAAYLVLTLRALMMRRNPLTFIFLSTVGAGLASLVGVAVIVLRQFLNFGDPIEFNGKEQLLARLIASALTCISAALLLILFRPLQGAFGFDEQGSRRYHR